MTGLLAGLVALVAALTGAPSAVPGGAEVLRDQRYGFCHNDDYLLDRWEHRWCPLVGERNEACPATRRVGRATPMGLDRPPVARPVIRPGVMVPRRVARRATPMAAPSPRQGMETARDERHHPGTGLPAGPSLYLPV